MLYNILVDYTSLFSWRNSVITLQFNYTWTEEKLKDSVISFLDNYFSWKNDMYLLKKIERTQENSN